MGFCKLRQRWPEQSPAERENELTEYINDLMRDWGMDPHRYSLTYQPVPDRPSANGGYDHHSQTIYIHPRLLEDDEPFGDTIAAETAAHEVRHAMQDEVYTEYGAPDGTGNPHDVGWREKDAEAFAASIVPDGLEECKDPDPYPGSGQVDEMPPPASPAGDFNLPSGDTAYA
ncbi:MAG: hypothetical protein MUD16_10710 [Desulfobacterales bacterium]|jgi:hypothetical protein|nr:hypothetical protein [Desulfobacterales bacterium]